MIEQKLSTIDTVTETAAKRAREVGTVLKALRKASEVGDLGQIHRQVAELDERLAQLSQISKSIKTELEFADEAYLSSEQYIDEICQAASVVGVRIAKGMGCLYSFPNTVKVNAQKKSLVIGKRRDSRLRPRFVAEELKRLQNDNGRISEAVFLEVLFSAYRLLGDHSETRNDLYGTSLPLSQLYSALTLLPQTAKDYSLSDFAVDIYRLDRSRLHRTRDGALLSLPASTGTRGSAGVLTVLGESGEEIRYFAIAFSAPNNVEKNDDATVA